MNSGRTLYRDLRLLRRTLERGGAAVKSYQDNVMILKEAMNLMEVRFGCNVCHATCA